MWYREFTDQRDAQAPQNHGIMYDEGQCLVQSHKEALIWYRKAADQGHALAQLNLCFMYQQGQGVVQSYKEALMCGTER